MPVCIHHLSQLFSQFVSSLVVAAHHAGPLSGIARRLWVFEADCHLAQESIIVFLLNVDKFVNHFLVVYAL